MSKYDALQNHLQQCGRDAVPMSFEDIEKVLGVELPASARRHRPWWSNNPHNNVMTKAWQAAGYKTEDVDLAGETVVFRRLLPKETLMNGQTQERISIVAVLSGTVTFAPGTDIAAPSGERWEADA